MSNGHNHSHAQGHGNSHGHAHAAPKNFNRAFAIGIVLNLAFVIIEASYGFIANSLALIADAGHNLSDVIGLVLAWGAVWLSTRKPSQRYTYGLRRSSILSALLNAVLLLVAVGGIAWEAIRRFWNPAEIQTGTVMIVAFIGIIINALTALLFASGRKEDLNIRGAYMHMAADALVSLGVVIAAFIIQQTHWLWMDPSISIAISVIITIGTWGLLRDSVTLAMDGVPTGVDIQEIRSYLAKSPGVQEVHDLHIWAMSTTETALTVHLVMPSALKVDEFLALVCKDLKHNYKIDHPTIQIESGDVNSFECALKPDEVV
ncbi:MAG: cation transporter [Bdellovibrionaceae bacterium]|nr:cation transporter [Pseudobdellovibrionaceae bacterium]